MAARTAAAAVELPGMMLDARRVEGEEGDGRPAACWEKEGVWAA